MKQIIKQLLIKIIKLYKLIISPYLGNKCRYLPTCSEYFKDSIMMHGLIFGSFLGFKRLFRCHPFGSFGYDPVPKKKLKDDKKRTRNS